MDAYNAAIWGAVEEQLGARERLLRELFERYALRGLDDWVLVEDVTDPQRVAFRFEHRPQSIRNHEAEEITRLREALVALVAGIEEGAPISCAFCYCYSEHLDEPDDHAPNCAYIAAKALLP